MYPPEDDYEDDDGEDDPIATSVSKATVTLSTSAPIRVFHPMQAQYHRS
jgi:hypothetical protein